MRLTSFPGLPKSDLIIDLVGTEKKVVDVGCDELKDCVRI